MENYYRDGGGRYVEHLKNNEQQDEALDLKISASDFLSLIPVQRSRGYVCVLRKGPSLIFSGEKKKERMYVI